ncbi:MAG: ornithine carbamoyltransferase [Nitrospirae bacterium]|nr:MAG: ornithine carbamoyltransferase [Nitrospirota bacterium]
MKRDFLKFRDLSKEETLSLIDRAIQLKKGADKNACPLIGKSIGMLFEKPSTRTRISFEVGIYQLGGQPIYMTPSEIQLSRGETIEDTARVLSRYLNAVVIRTFSQEKLERFAQYASVPVINALTDSYHPCQVLADLMTIKERFQDLEGVKLAYIGDGNNVANSLVEAAIVVGFSLFIACPEGYEPSPEVLDEAHETGANVVILREPKEAVAGADVIYTDVWISMGQEQEKEERLKRFRPFQINKDLLKCARADTIVMHCLPAHRGQEITDDVIDGPQSVVFDQAENRLHAQKALLEWLLSSEQ